MRLLMGILLMVALLPLVQGRFIGYPQYGVAELSDGGLRGAMYIRTFPGEEPESSQTNPSSKIQGERVRWSMQSLKALI